jgi:hypothetical protein
MGRSQSVLNRWSAASLLLIAGLLLSALGCSSRSAEEIVSDRARVLGTWEYRTDGIGSLQHGTLRITMQEGRLVGRLQDSWRGQVEARVLLRGPRMELDLRRIRIRGRLDVNEFRGTVRRPFWDASRTNARRQQTGSFVARRVRRGSLVDDLTELGCASLLRESSYRCSPLPHP